MTVTNLGHASDNAAANTLTGYTAYDISITADPGFNVSAVDLGGVNGTVGDGIFGPLLQKWTYSPPVGSLAAYPVRIQTATKRTKRRLASTFGLDSHIVVTLGLGT